MPSSRLLLLPSALLLACAIGRRDEPAGEVSSPPVVDSEDVRAALMDADRAFAAETAARGLEGWMSYYTDDAVRVALGDRGIAGLDGIRDYDAALFADSTTRLVWEPTDGGVFEDGTYGFTTGRSAMVRPGTPDTLWKGRYVTLWRRGPDGRWRVILDTGA